MNNVWYDIEILWFVIET